MTYLLKLTHLKWLCHCNEFGSLCLPTSWSLIFKAQVRASRENGGGGWEGEVGSENPNSCSLLFCPLLSILTRILPWQVPCPPLLINRGPVWTLGEKVPHGPRLVWKKLFMISLPSISFKHVQKGTLPMVILQLKSLSGCPTSLFVAYFSDSF